eukprot:15472834-Alexandrium_andersonii.AAC.1
MCAPAQPFWKKGQLPAIGRNADRLLQVRSHRRLRRGQGVKVFVSRVHSVRLITPSGVHRVRA